MARRPAPDPPARRSAWAPRCAVLSTVALVLAFVTTGSGRALFAFLWVCLAIAAFALEWAARRRVPGAAPARRGRLR